MKVVSSLPSRLELYVDSDWSEMESVFMAVQEFLGTLGLAQDFVGAFTMIACELVENSIKYGSFKTTKSHVDITLSLDPRSISFAVRNPIGDVTAPYLQELDRVIQWVRGFQDPFEAYIARMKAISNEPLEASSSGLGIVRMAYEGRASLDFYLEEDAVLNVSAVSLIS
jgi:hypothetical protein